MDRFWEKVNKTNSCWLWTASGTAQGYGRFRIGHKKQLAHRISWEIHNGPIPIGMLVCHKCDNPPCVNPHHLFLGSISDNTKDMYLKKRRSQSRANNGNAKLNKKQVQSIIKEYKPYIVTQKNLAKKYGVSESAIGHILRGYSWGAQDEGVQ